MPRAKAEAVGMSSKRLAAITATLKADVDAGRLPGDVVAVARRGNLVYHEAVGFQDKARPDAPHGGTLLRRRVTHCDQS